MVVVDQVMLGRGRSQEVGVIYDVGNILIPTTLGPISDSVFRSSDRFLLP